ncbi:hypothetical protein SISNIDRAFT_545982 [Sistotremastrum niveocremeum HHB9708]|uniref:SHSP domain-containing protein n=2 Tax=Sistotremastraceae TaxID=3402574 RepID=A0A165AKQ3_9AGAM|nr:hypothetical protein SISNIDRAFT_545982 [Sistotremastrum niveocremeum HHB9708]KZT42001.1 hypothetical protein SISSUDRAFT_1125935 [Sistotremastrum suecicum HHB10207 ss-3]
MSSQPQPTALAHIRSTRQPSHMNRIDLSVNATPTQHVLLAPLGPGFTIESITISAKRGNILAIVAERFDMEADCHYEWQVQFDRDADMGQIHANLDRGMLTVSVRRIPDPTRRP